MRMAEIAREVEVEASSRTAKYTYSELYEYVHVYCVCHLPESYDSNMIECDNGVVHGSISNVWDYGKMHCLILGFVLTVNRFS